MKSEGTKDFTKTSPSDTEKLLQFLQELNSPSTPKGSKLKSETSASLIKELIDLDFNPQVVEKINKVIEFKQGIENTTSNIKSHRETQIVINVLKKSLMSTLRHSKSVQIIAIIMFSLTFLFGIALLSLAFYFGTRDKEVLSIAFGAFGVASIVALFIADPPLKIQDSRSNYTQLTIATLNWFSDFYDKTTLVGQLNQQFNSQVAFANDFDTISNLQNEFIKKYLEVSESQIKNTKDFLMLIEEVAEPSGKRKKKKASAILKKELKKIKKEALEEK